MNPAPSNYLFHIHLSKNRKNNSFYKDRPFENEIKEGAR
jgi:hypothetical protein